MSRLSTTITLLLLLGASPACTPFRPPSLTPPLPAPEAQPAERSSTPPGTPAAESPAHPADELLAETIPGEIVRLAAITQNHLSDAAERSESLRRLTILHLSPKNPARDLELAAAAQAAYLETLAPGLLRQEAEIWLELIKAALNGEQLQRQQALVNRENDKALAALGAEKQRLLQKITGLESSNAKLKGDIEKLKFIDLSMEKKRQIFR